MKTEALKGEAWKAHREGGGEARGRVKAVQGRPGRAKNSKGLAKVSGKTSGFSSSVVTKNRPSSSGVPESHKESPLPASVSNTLHAVHPTPDSDLGRLQVGIAYLWFYP